MDYRCIHTVKAGGTHHPPGAVIGLSDEDAGRLLAAGAIEPAVADGPEKDDYTVSELEELADELGIDRSAIRGTGKGGRVVKADLYAAIEAAETSGEQDA